MFMNILHLVTQFLLLFTTILLNLRTTAKSATNIQECLTQVVIRVQPLLPHQSPKPNHFLLASLSIATQAVLGQGGKHKLIA